MSRTESHHAAMEKCCEGICGSGTWTIRVWAPGLKFGDPYSWTATCIRVTEDTVELRGVLQAPTPSEYRALRKMFKETGWVRWVTFERKRDGKSRWRSIKIQK